MLLGEHLRRDDASCWLSGLLVRDQPDDQRDRDGSRKYKRTGMNHADKKPSGEPVPLTL